VIHILEFGDKKTVPFKIAQYVLILATVGISLMLIFCRGHYSIDIFGGCIFGHYFWVFAENRSWIIDYALFKIPFHKRFPNMQSRCGNCKEPINRWATHMRQDFSGQVTSFKMETKTIGIKIYQTEKLAKEGEFKYPDVRQV
jgi:hypothetical protein